MLRYERSQVIENGRTQNDWINAFKEYENITELHRGVIVNLIEKIIIYAKMLKKYPDVLKIEQMCEALGGMSTKTGYKMLREGRIGSVKVGREYRITKVDIIDYLMKAN